MKVRMPFGRVAFFVAAFFFSLVALTPLGLAISWLGLDARGLAAREAQGSVWLGALKEAQLGPAPIGDVSARFHSLRLFIGQARVSLARADETQPFEGSATVSRHGFGFDDATGHLRLGALLAPLPINAIQLENVSIGFASGLCSRAEGRVRAMASGDVGGMSLSSGLAGNASCAGDAALLPLAGQSGMEQLNIRLFADGRYRAELLVRSQDAALGQRLVAAGFTAGNGGFTRVVDGRF
ncbi:type II secretion system protein N [Sphingosinicella sp.]|uniref:type II secretion system protein N n=1 Tax=Sphingosinicella sp. TaxID=1917971 RepID=UPI0040381DE5